MHQAWIADRLGSGSNSQVSRQVAQYEQQIGSKGNRPSKSLDWLHKCKNH
jgi:hypothetical protein